MPGFGGASRKAPPNRGFSCCGSAGVSSHSGSVPCASCGGDGSSSAHTPSMRDETVQTRRAFVARMAALGLLAVADRSWFADAALAAKPRPPIWTPGRNMTGAFQNPAFAVAADSSSGRTYAARCVGGTIQIARSFDDGATFTQWATIPGITGVSDMPLDRPLVVDSATKRIHALYQVSADDTSRPASLHYIHS